MRGLNYEWSMEDLNEDIKFSHGRQRRQLIKQRERTELAHEKEEEHIDKARENQEELWERSDEYYEAQKAHILENQAMEREEFDINKQNRVKLWELEDKRFNLQVSQREEMFDLTVKEFEENKRYRKEIEQLSIQEFQLTQQQREEFYEKEKEHLAQQIADYQVSHGIQVAIAIENERHQEEMLRLEEERIKKEEEYGTSVDNTTIAIGEIQDVFASLQGTLGAIADNNPSKQLELLDQLMTTIAAIDVFKLKKLIEFVYSIEE
jgi:hypothetical protein